MGLVKELLGYLFEHYNDEFHEFVVGAGYGYCDDCEERRSEPTWGFC